MTHPFCSKEETVTMPAGAQFPNLMPALLARWKSPICCSFLMISESKERAAGNV